MSRQPRKVAVFSEPSNSALNVIKSLWTNSQSAAVFPILPTRCASELSHLITESGCSDIITLGPSNVTEQVRDWLGVTIHCIGRKVPEITDSKIGTLLVAGRAHTFSIGLVAEIENLESQISRNRKLLSSLTGPLMPMNRHWVLDSFSHDQIVYESTSPSSITVDSHMLSKLLSDCEKGDLDISKLENLVFDISADSISSETIVKLKSIGAENILGRLLVPELGPIAELVPVETISDLKNLIGLGDFQISIDGDKRMQVTYVTDDVVYCNRESRTSEGRRFTTSISVMEESAVSTRKGRWMKKRIMQPDWRVRQVPVSVYHKKRGFKGQIYYTTKHKGWSFYKSRY